MIVSFSVCNNPACSYELRDFLFLIELFLQLKNFKL
jgi:hypothetical protein